MLKSRILFVASAIFACHVPMAQGTDKYVLTDKEAVLVHPPKLACAFELTNLAWSSDGKHLLVQRFTPMADQDQLSKFIRGKLGRVERSTITLELFEIQSGKSTKIWEGDSDLSRVRSIAFLTGSQRAFAVLEKRKSEEPFESWTSSLVTFTTGSPKISILRQAPEGSSLAFYASPVKPLGFLVQISGPGAPVVSPEGVSSKALSTGVTGAAVDSQARIGDWKPVSMEARYGSIVWSQDGSRAILRGTTGVSHDPVTGVSTLAREGDYYVPSTAKDLELLIQRKEIGVNSTIDTVPFSWLSSNTTGHEKTALVVAGGPAMFSPTRDSILYVHEGMAFVRTLTRIPLAKFNQAMEEMERTRLMNEAKQCILGFIIYSADNDGNLPSPASDWQKELHPYVKNNKLLEGFVFTFSGNLDKVESPAKTQVGFKQGVGGRAVAFADGHVEWVRD